MKIYIFGKKAVLNFIVIFVLVLVFLLMPKPSLNKLVETAAKAKKELPIYCVETDKKQVAVSFDAAWGADDTDKLLAILKKHNVKATFFLVGGWIDKYPEEVKKIHAEGHDIGNHSAKHPDMTKLTKEQIKQELMIPHKKIKDLVGVEMNLFRPPFGAYNDTVIKTARECGYYTIQWDVDSLDWKELGKQNMIDRVLKNKALGNGSIILFHNNAKYTKDALDTILTELEKQGYEIVPISQLILKNDFYIDHIGRQRKKKE